MLDSSISSEHGVQWSMCSSAGIEHEFRMCNVVQHVFTCACVEAIGHGRFESIPRNISFVLSYLLLFASIYGFFAEHVIPWDSIHYKLKWNTKTKSV